MGDNSIEDLGMGSLTLYDSLSRAVTEPATQIIQHDTQSTAPTGEDIRVETAREIPCISLFFKPRLSDSTRASSPTYSSGSLF